MILPLNQKPVRKIEIDLSGPDGNAFVLIGLVGKLAPQLGKDKKKITDEMTNDDYDHLISVFEREFGEHVILYR